jgi:hypothetical protein
MTNSVFRRELIDWANQLPETARLGLNDTHDRVELQGISYEMRRNFDILASRAGVRHPLAFLYLGLRDSATKAKARNGSAPPYFHDLPYRRTAYRGNLKIESASMKAFIQPLGGALLEHCNDADENEISTAANPALVAAGNALPGPNSVSLKRGRTPIPLETKRLAWEAKQKPGNTLRDAAKILYRTDRPTAGQVKNVPSILSYYRKSLKDKKLSS